jgi:hypothetical protein
MIKLEANIRPRTILHWAPRRIHQERCSRVLKLSRVHSNQESGETRKNCRRR